MTFSNLGLSTALLNAISEQGYETPSPIQAQAIPAVLDGRDVMAAAQTGTGKTAGFTLPLLERLKNGKPVRGNQVRALILTPTRELAAQVADSVETYGKHLPLKSAVVFGGVKINPQMMKLRRGADVLVATPGRLLDLFNQNAVRFDQLEILVLDEADRMLDMGFIRDIRKILNLLPERRQNLMFSATFSDEIRDLAKGLVNDPVEISVSPRNTTAKTVEQCLYSVDKKRKPALLAELIKSEDWQQVLVFTRTKHGANRLTRFLDSNNIKAAAIHGNKSQGARTRALADFKSGEIQALVATDIAARGIDIDQLPQVVNFELPNVAEDYVHRIGRTGRAGAGGHAISLVSADEFQQLSDIERLIQELIPRKSQSGFEAVNQLPESRLKAPRKPKKPKKPKKAKTDVEVAEQPESASSNKPKNGQPNKRKRKPKARNSDGNRSREDNRNREGNKTAARSENSKQGEHRDGQRPAGKRRADQRSADKRPAGERPAAKRRRRNGPRPAKVNSAS